MQDRSDKLRLPPKEELLEYLLSFDYFEKNDNPEEGRIYATHHLDRFLLTLRNLPDLPPGARVLELGASPYFMSLLIMKYLGWEIVPANFFGDYGEVLEKENQSTINSVRFGESHTFKFKMFNLEMDTFPYEDDQFDLVLCCEILEHLAWNPCHMIRESHRVLKDGGYMVITTPNMVRMQNVGRILRGQNIYDPYSGNGVYGRHNREYTPDELWDLLLRHNFHPDVIVDDAYPHNGAYRFFTGLSRRTRRRRDNLIGIGRKHGKTVEVFPDWMFTAPLAHKRILRNEILMGDRDGYQLGQGWFGFEHWPPGIRWTGPTATAFLRPLGGETQLCMRLIAGPLGLEGRILINGQAVGEGRLDPKQAEQLQIPIPIDLVKGARSGAIPIYEVRIQVDNPHVPARDVPGEQDHRELGVAVEKLWLT